MIKILFVCHGNICRSVMAEYVMNEMIRQKGAEELFEIDSAATSREEIGNRIYPPADRKLRKEGIPVGDHRARQMTLRDYDYFDRIYIMDQYNMRNLRRIIGEDRENKVRYLIDRDVADPWYTGDFDSTFRDVTEGCMNILNEVLGESE